MPPVDLTAARERVTELLMTDSCVIDRSQLGTQEWVLNEDTGDLTEPLNDSTEIYDGICQVVAGADGGSLPAEIGLKTSLNAYTVRLPWDQGDEVAKGDYVSISTCNDSSLEGVQMQVLHVVRTSLLVWRELVCQLLETDRGS